MVIPTAVTAAIRNRTEQYMPTVAEAAVVVAGQIADIQDSKDFNTQAPDGVKVLLSTGDGFASVKIKTDRLAEVQPAIGKSVAWVLRYGANGGADRKAAAYSAFVREVNENDIDRIVSSSRVAPSGK